MRSLIKSLIMVHDLGPPRGLWLGSQLGSLPLVIPELEFPIRDLFEVPLGSCTGPFGIPFCNIRLKVEHQFGTFCSPQDILGFPGSV